MKATNVTQISMYRALGKINKRYNGNISFARMTVLLIRSHNKETINFTLKVDDNHGQGARVYRRFGKIKRTHRACWHVHGYFFEALFEVCPEAVVISAGKKITKDGGNWQPVGNGMGWAGCEENACDCNRGIASVKTIKETPDGITVKTLSKAQIEKCPSLIFDPDHYKADGTCLCFDRGHQNKLRAERAARTEKLLKAQGVKR